MAIKLQQSANDKRLYRYVVLPNGLQAVLISDPEAQVDESEEHSHGEDSHCSDCGCGSHMGEDSGSEDGAEDEECHEQHVKRAAAALAVGTGSFSDPEDVQGLSHYLEHMLFMGSEKYPDENEYDSYLAKYGGSSNAFTEMEQTNYHFDVKPDRLYGALDRFAQFFIAPLCKADALEREVQAVNNEFVGVQQNDGCRLAQLRSHTAKGGHLYRKFTWGNRKSLVEQPAAAGIDVRQRLLDYYKTAYGADRMSLAVLGGQDLDTLEEWVRQLFSAVPCAQGPRPNFSGLPRPYKGGQLHLLPAVKQAHELVVTFQLPSLLEKYLAKAEDYLSNLIGHEGSGSLLSALKARGWASGLSAGVPDGGYERNSALFLFEVSATLTEAGLNAGPGMGLAVVQLLFEYLGMLRARGPQRWLYQELAEVGAMKARFLEEEEAMDYVTGVASNLLLVRPQHVLLADFLYEDWQPELITGLLDQMVPSEVRVDIQTSDYDQLREACLVLPGASTSMEPWFDIPFTAAPIPAEVLRRCEAAAASPGSELDLPARNEFIPTDFSLRCDATSDVEASATKRQKQNGASNGDVSAANGMANGQQAALLEPPAAVVEQEGLRLWHKLDRGFRTPRALAGFQIASAAVYDSPRAAAALALALKLLQEAMNETTYMADLAGLQCDMWPEGRSGLEVKVEGFSHKLPLLTRTLLQRLAAFEVPEEHFGHVKEALVRKYGNANLSVDRHATYLRLRALKHVWDVEEVHSALQKLDPPAVQEWMRQALQHVHIEALVEGNITKQEASELALAVAQLFPGQKLPASERPEDSVARIPEGSSLLVRQRAKNAEEENSAVEVYYQVALDGLQERAALDLLGQIASEPCFNVLRTQEQLGYSVHCGVRLTHNVLGFAFVILSGSHAPTHLDARIEAFLTGFAAELASLDPAEFERHREALIAAKLQKDRSLQDAADRHWEQISNRRLQFNAREEEVEVLRTLQQEDVAQFFAKFLQPGSPHRAKLAVHVVAKAHAAELAAAVPKGVEVFTDPEALRSSLKAYPPPTATYRRV